MTFIEFAARHPEQFRAALAELPIERIADLLDRGDSAEVGNVVSHCIDVAAVQTERKLEDEARAPFTLPSFGDETPIMLRPQAD